MKNKTRMTQSEKRKLARIVPVKTLIVVILDQSGSMQSVVDDTIGGFNAFLHAQKQADTALTVQISMTLFSGNCQIGKPMALKKLRPLDRQDYVPAGNTALLDAVGHTIRALDPVATQADRVLCLLLTDGRENASKEFTKAAVKSLLQSKEKSGKWTFTFMGANQDSFTEARGLGIRRGNTRNYESSSRGTHHAFQTASEATSRYLKSPTQQTGNFHKNAHARREPRKENPVI